MIMSKKVVDIAGRKFGRLTALRIVGKKHNNVLWLFDCECGKQTITQGRHARSGNTKSCGCLQRDKATIHGSSHTREYYIWKTMHHRCNNPKTKCYHYYGGRGIQVCKRWGSFKNFLTDMGKRPSSKHSINRIDNDGNYTPKNCRWVLITQQANNKSSSRFLKAFGSTLTIAEWARLYSINYLTLYYRIKRGWSIERSLTTPTHNTGKQTT